MIPWDMGKQLVCDVPVADSLASSRPNQGCLSNRETTANETEARKTEKYCNLIDKGHIVQQVAMYGTEFSRRKHLCFRYASL